MRATFVTIFTWRSIPTYPHVHAWSADFWTCGLPLTLSSDLSLIFIMNLVMVTMTTREEWNRVEVREAKQAISSSPHMEAHQSSFLRTDDHQLQISSTSDDVGADNEDDVLGNQSSFLFTADHQLQMMSTMIRRTSHRFYSYSYPRGGSS